MCRFFYVLKFSRYNAQPCSSALERLIQGLRLFDVWDSSINMQAYAHYTLTGAARLDRV